jgi:hypothetical protein
VAVSKRKTTSLKILLLALLLAVQALGHAHAIDHAFSGDSTFCSICSLTGHNDAIGSDCCETTVCVPLPRNIPNAYGPSIVQACEHLPDARAPHFS